MDSVKSRDEEDARVRLTDKGQSFISDSNHQISRYEDQLMFTQGVDSRRSQTPLKISDEAEDEEDEGMIIQRVGDEANLRFNVEPDANSRQLTEVNEEEAPVEEVAEDENLASPLKYVNRTDEHLMFTDQPSSIVRDGTLAEVTRQTYMGEENNMGYSMVPQVLPEDIRAPIFGHGPMSSAQSFTNVQEPYQDFLPKTELERQIYQEMPEDYRQYPQHLNEDEEDVEDQQFDLHNRGSEEPEAH